MRKLIFAWHYVEWGGAQTCALAIIKAARGRYDVSVVMPKGSSPDLCRQLEAAGAACEFYGPPTDLDPAPSLLRRLQRRWSTIVSERLLVRHLLRKDLSASILHVDFAPQKTLLSLFRLARKANVFLTLHNSFPKTSHLRDLIWKTKIRSLSRLKRLHFFCANEDAKRYLSDVVAENAASRVTLVRAAIDPVAIRDVLIRPFDRNKTLEDLGLPDTKKVILTVGQFIDRKGRWTLLEAAQKIFRERQDLLFLWVMPELPGADDLRRVQDYGLADDFRMIRSADLGNERGDILTFFRVADLFVLPSFVEGLPIALIEAMALGTPCISTNVHGIPEAIESGHTGILIEPGDPEALASAMLKVIDDKRLSEQFAQDGQAFVLATFDERLSAKIALTEYDRCFLP